MRSTAPLEIPRAGFLAHLGPASLTLVFSPGGSTGGISGPSGAGQSDAGKSPEAPLVVGQGIVIDASMLACILNQARGPILDRLYHQLSPFASDGVVETVEWLVAYERL